MANISERAAAPSGEAPAWLAALGQRPGFIARELVCDNPSPAEHAPDGPDDRVAEALRLGREEGMALAERRQREHEAARDRLSLALRRLDEAALGALRQHLVETVAQLCETAIAPHMLDRDRVAERCSRLAEAIGEAPIHCILHLHPDDAELLDPQVARDWGLRLDPSLPRGSLRLEGREGMVRDGPDEWRRAFAAALSAADSGE